MQTASYTAYLLFMCLQESRPINASQEESLHGVDQPPELQLSRRTRLPDENSETECRGESPDDRLLNARLDVS